jgi:hypothetical protein
MDNELIDQFFQHSSEEVIDHSKDAVNEVTHTISEPSPATHLYDCMADQGQEYGQHVASSDLQAQTVGMHPDPAAYNHAFSDALAGCHYDDYVPHDVPSIPSLTNPSEAFVEVAFTPGSLNSGETEYFGSQHAFDNAFQSTYQESVHSAFDHQLSSHLDIDWGHEHTPVAPTVDRAQDFQVQTAFDAFTGFSAPSAVSEAPAATHNAFDSASAPAGHGDMGGTAGHGDAPGSTSHGDSGGTGGSVGSASDGGL